MSALLQPPSNEVEPGTVAAEGGTDAAERRLPEPDVVAEDRRLVARVRCGDDRAFEALYERYHRRIHSYVFGMVKDHQRAEDVTQEVFVSALRRMRATERPIAFKPWIYEIAKNACIDQFRRSRRAEEVSMDADDGLAPSDYGRLVSTAPVPDAALVAKQQLDDLCGAFGGLSDAHHEILVLRELEGLSYREIGEKMGMSRPAVESTLFRARRRLTEEYDELASGQRCQRIQSIIANAGGGRLGARDTRRLARHVAHCQPCRRQALAAGVVDATVAARKPARQRAIEKVAALFPFPLLLRGRRDGGPESWLGQLPVMSDHAAAGGAKLAAVAALVVAGMGAGAGTHVGVAGEDRASDRPARVSERAAPERSSSTVVPPELAPVAGAAAGEQRRRETSRPDSGARNERTADRRARSEAAIQRRESGGTGPQGQSLSRETPATNGAGSVGESVRRQAPAEAPSAPAGPSTPVPGSPSTGTLGAQLPEITVPAATVPGSTLETGSVTGTLEQGVKDVGAAVQDTLESTTDAVNGTLQGVAGLGSGSG